MGLKDDLKKLKEKLDAKAEGKPKPAKAEVVYKCGHTLPVGELKNHDCRQCQQQKKDGPRKKASKGRPIVARLPRGSTYHLNYYEEEGQKRWVGTLLVPNPEDQEALAITFAGEASSVHFLLDVLGKKWRDWERKEAAKRAEGSPPPKDPA